ncbi:MGPA protein [Clostridia bacterium]|nr:MGPA protein [Clostridia bacterium]
MNEYKLAYKKIKRANNIIVLPHKNADGDALGCAYAMKCILEEMGKRARVVCEETEEHKLMCVVCRGAELRSAETAADFEADLVISVDCADLGRLGERVGIFEQAGDGTICFDHHKSCTNFANINCVVPDSGACGEVLYEFCKANKIKINTDIANNLYLAISSDTGGFRQSNASPETLEIAADLMRLGANSGKINTALFLSNTISHTRLVGDVLRDLRFDEEHGISVIKSRQEQLKKYNCTQDDSEGLVNFARNIIGVNVGIFLREKDDGGIKGSLRSNYDEYDVSEICANFGGGGHLRAAGCDFNDCTIEEAEEKLFAETARYIDERDERDSSCK